MLYDYLKENYKEAEPIFFSDVDIEGITRSAISQQFKKLCEEDKLIKYENGIYYLPKQSKLNNAVGINADMVARYKYIYRRGRTIGYYSGNTLANQIGISNQVPNKVEIVSNNMAAKVREVTIGKRVFIVRKSSIEVTEENVHTLQMLELLKNLDAYVEDDFIDAKGKFQQYIDAYGITRIDIDRYIRKYPLNVFKHYYELRLDDVLA